MSEEKSMFSSMSDNIIPFLWSQRIRIIIICVLAIICSTIASYMLPVKFKATTVVFASPSNNPARSLLSEHQDPWDYLSMGDEKTCEHVLPVFQSNELMMAVNKKFGLMERYDIPANANNKYAMLKDEFKDNFSFDITEYQSIKIDVMDKDPVMAANMANTVVDVADSLFRKIMSQRTSAAYDLVSQQYDSTRRNLNVLEDSMNFFRKIGILNFDYQVKEYTRGYAEAEVKGSPSSVQAMEGKLKPFQEYGKPFWALAYKLGNEYNWYKVVSESYIQAKINKDKYLPPFYIAEKAVPADKKAYPIRWLVVFGSTLATLFFTIVLLLLIHKFSLQKQNHE